jgi:glycerophosphoryl diester phosphodiesterase
MTLKKSILAACTIAICCGCATGHSTGVAAEGAAMFDLQGHRGARGLRPENTLAAFRYALGIGVTTLELDCGVTKDGIVVVSHDSLLNPDITRGPDGKYLERPGPAIVDLTFAELQQYDVGRLKPGSDYAANLPDQQPVDGERIPRLADVFALAAQGGNASVRFNVETKLEPQHPEQALSPLAFVRALIAVIREAGVASRTTIQSFDWRTLRLAHELAPEIALVALTDQQEGEDTVEVGKPGASPWLGELDVDDYGGSVPRLVSALGARTWSPHARDLSPGLVAKAHALGIEVIPWTVNDPKDMELALAAGVDGLITDRPDRLRALLASKGIKLPVPTPVP